MYTYSYDQNSALLVGILSGSASSDQDYETLCQTILRLDQEGRSHPEGTKLVVLVSTEHGRPNPTWRRRFAELTPMLTSPKKLSIVITRSLLIRGAITAIQWVSLSSKISEAVQVFPAFEEAVRWLEKRFGRPFPEARSMYRDATAGLLNVYG